MPFEIANMSFAARQTNVLHTNKAISSTPWISVDVWSPGANAYVKADRWTFTPPVAAGTSHTSTLKIERVDAADDAEIAKSIGMQMRIRVGFGSTRREYLTVNLTP